jgi:hypothetical protein
MDDSNGVVIWDFDLDIADAQLSSAWDVSNREYPDAVTIGRGVEVDGAFWPSVISGGTPQFRQQNPDDLWKVAVVTSHGYVDSTPERFDALRMNGPDQRLASRTTISVNNQQTDAVIHYLGRDAYAVCPLLAPLPFLILDRGEVFGKKYSVIDRTEDWLPALDQHRPERWVCYTRSSWSRIHQRFIAAWTRLRDLISNNPA